MLNLGHGCRREMGLSGAFQGEDVGSDWLGVCCCCCEGIAGFDMI
jgi:hypothetical protein